MDHSQCLENKEKRSISFLGRESPKWSESDIFGIFSCPHNLIELEDTRSQIDVLGQIINGERYKKKENPPRKYKKFDGQRVERHPRRPCFAACARSRGANPRTATANERRGRAVIGRYYKRGRRCPGTVSCTSDRAARGCAGERG